MFILGGNVGEFIYTLNQDPRFLDFHKRAMLHHLTRCVKVKEKKLGKSWRDERKSNDGAQAGESGSDAHHAESR